MNMKMFAGRFLTITRTKGTIHLYGRRTEAKPSGGLNHLTTSSVASPGPQITVDAPRAFIKRWQADGAAFADQSKLGASSS